MSDEVQDLMSDRCYGSKQLHKATKLRHCTAIGHSEFVGVMVYSNSYYTSPYCRVTDFENFLLMIQHLDHRCMYNDSGCFTAHRENHNPQPLPHRGSSTGLLLNCSPKFYHVTSVFTILWPNGNWARVRIGIRVRVPVGMKANVRNQRAKIRRSRSRLKV